MKSTFQAKENINMSDKKILDFQMETAELNAEEILGQMFEQHQKTGDGGVYDITLDGKLGDKLHDL